MLGLGFEGLVSMGIGADGKIKIVKRRFILNIPLATY